MGPKGVESARSKRQRAIVIGIGAPCRFPRPSEYLRACHPKTQISFNRHVMSQPKQSKGGWLFKEDPDCYTFDQFEKDGGTTWTGVNNALARKHLRLVQLGDAVLYYHTGK